jgi:hypothetical protein
MEASRCDSVSVIAISHLGFVSDFEIRASDFGARLPFRHQAALW